ncbi:MAG TPA: GAF domain-containing sensor histidine kinase [Kofleriaceae bacterium]|jgi:signal transduction histidine kinase|nr:GAF domain-containing sensor histidine kinase [Kofleriaceae bacterium]
MNRPAYETARLELVRLRLESARGIDGALGRVARVCARTLGVERVGVWLFDDAYSRLTCHSLYTQTEDISRGGDVLDTRRFPTYCAALRERRAIVADDARTHPLTRELGDDYLAPLGIVSMLDAPIYRRGHVVGVVCHEHVGQPRVWKQPEIEFASSVAEVVGAMYEQSEVLALDDELSRRAARQHEADRLESITRVCSAVAHDFNNVLTMVSMVAAQLSRNAGSKDMSQALDNAVGVGSRLIKQLRSFVARPAGDDIKRARVADVVEHLRPILELLLRDVVTLVQRIDAPDAEAAIGPGPLEQILLNLCLNARDAIAVRGKVEVVVRDEPRHVVIEVRDDGAGIAADVVPHIFEPYFTTKDKGTGLGLATVRDLVTEHGGTITVESEHGRGTCFTVTLPRA